MKEFTQDDQQKWQSISTLTKLVLEECTTYGQLIVVDFKTGKVVEELKPVKKKRVYKKRKATTAKKATTKKSKTA